MWRFLRQPVLAGLIKERKQAAVLTVSAFILFGSALSGISLWACPVKTFLGIPCPGCGLGRAMLLFIRGEWRAAMTLHAFAPLFWVGGIVIFLGAVLPGRHREQLYRTVEKWEITTGITVIILILFLIYWVGRFFI